MRGRGHQQRLRLSLARLQRGAGVAHLARQQQTFEIEQRFIDDDRPQFRRLVHDVVPVCGEVALRRLLDVGDALESRAVPAPAPVAETPADTRRCAQRSLKSSEYARCSMPRLFCTSAVIRSTCTTRSTSQRRSSPLSLILRCVRPSNLIHCGSVSGNPSPTGLTTSVSSSGSSAPMRWYNGMRGCGVRETCRSS